MAICKYLLHFLIKTNYCNQAQHPCFACPKFSVIALSAYNKAYALHSLLLVRATPNRGGVAAATSHKQDVICNCHVLRVKEICCRKKWHLCQLKY